MEKRGMSVGQADGLVPKRAADPSGSGPRRLRSLPQLAPPGPRARTLRRVPARGRSRVGRQGRPLRQAGVRTHWFERAQTSEQARLLDMDESVDRDPDAAMPKTWWLYLGRPGPTRRRPVCCRAYKLPPATAAAYLEKKRRAVAPVRVASKAAPGFRPRCGLFSWSSEKPGRNATKPIAGCATWRQINNELPTRGGCRSPARFFYHLINFYLVEPLFPFLCIVALAGVELL